MPETEKDARGKGTGPKVAPMRVLLVAEALDASGVTSYVETLARALARRRHAVRLLAPGGPRAAALREAGVEVLEVPGLFRGSFFPRTKGAVRAARAFSPNVIHATELAALGRAARLGARTGTPHVATAHRFPRAAREARPRAATRAILAVSEALREYLVNHLLVPKELISVVPNGVAVPAHPPTLHREVEEEASPAAAAAVAAMAAAVEAEANGGEANEGVPRRIPAVGCFGRLVPRKGRDVFLEAARLVLDRGCDAEFVLAGRGPELKRLLRRARELKLRSRLTVRTEGVGAGRVMPALDIFVEPSLQEGLGLATLEAMAWGLPVVASAVGGLLGVVREGETGYLVPPRDPEAIADRIVSLASDARLRREMGQAGRALVESEFTVRRMVDLTEAAYRRALNNNNARANGRAAAAG